MDEVWLIEVSGAVGRRREIVAGLQESNRALESKNGREAVGRYANHSPES